jgi:hypothetical protein
MEGVTSAELGLARIERGLSTAIVALEILTGICAGLEDTDLEGTAEPAEGERFPPHGAIRTNIS